MRDQIILYRQGDELPSELKKIHANNFAYNFFLNQPHYYIENMTSEAILLALNDHIVVCTVSDNEIQDTYISSLYSLYFNCGLEEAEKVIKPIWYPLLWCVFKTLGLLAKMFSFNKTIQVNNQFTASIIQPSWLVDHIEEITQFLMKHFPNHAIILPRFSPKLNPALDQTLKQLNYRFFSTGPIYIFDPQDGKYKSKRDTKKDRKLLANGSHQVRRSQKLSTEDLAKIHRLYNQLYIEKHSHYNPNFRDSFWVDAARYGWLEFICLIDKTSGIDAFLGLQTIDKTCLVSPVGINTKTAHDLELNRLIYATAIQYSEENELLLHYGPGSGKFKNNRGAETLPNGNMVMYQHLPKHQQFIWSLLDTILNKYVAKYINNLALRTNS